MQEIVNGLKREGGLFFTNKKLTILSKVELKQDVFVKDQPILFVHTSKTGGTNVDYLSKALSKKQSLQYIELYDACKGEKSINIFPNGCVGGLEKIKKSPHSYDLTNRNKVKFILGHIPLPTNDYFKKEINYISIVRDPVDRLLSLGNFVFQRNSVEEKDIEKLLLSKEVDNLQTRAIAGEEFMSGDCTEETFNQAVKNIQDKFAIVAPIEEVETVMSLIANHLNFENIAFSNAQITGAKVISKKDTELCDKLLERNSYDRKLYEFVKDHWASWKEDHIESMSDNISNKKYMVLSESFYSGKSAQYLDYAQINLLGEQATDDLIGFKQS
jgi:hypothetical protein